jgi:hypothetical protein
VFEVCNGNNWILLGGSGPYCTVICPEASKNILCGEPVQDACGGVCATLGRALDIAQCPEEGSFICGEAGEEITDQCGNTCPGTSVLACNDDDACNGIETCDSNTTLCLSGIRIGLPLIEILIGNSTSARPFTFDIILSSNFPHTLL